VKDRKDEFIMDSFVNFVIQSLVYNCDGQGSKNPRGGNLSALTRPVIFIAHVLRQNHFSCSFPKFEVFQARWNISFRTAQSAEQSSV
jgi:hypothetical protein